MIAPAPSIVPWQWIAAFARASAFAATAPLAGSGAVPNTVRAALALTLTYAVAAHLGGRPFQGTVEAAFIENAVVGAAFGIGAAGLAAAAASAGSIVDGILASRIVGREPVFGGAAGPFSHLYSLGFATAFIGSGAMTRVCERFAAASSATVFTPTINGAAALGRASLESALDIAAPAILAQLLGTIVAAVAARAAPRINGLALSSPLVTVLLLLMLLAGVPATFAKLVALARIAGHAPAL